MLITLAHFVTHCLFFFYSMIGSDSSTTDYPGKITSGADVPSDPAKWEEFQAPEVLN